MIHATCRKANLAFSLVDLMVVIVLLAVLVGILWPMAQIAERKPKIVTCMSHLRQTAIGFTMWSDDNGGSLPWQVPTNQGGTLELILNGRAVDHFLMLSNYVKNPQVMHCPTDLARGLTTNFAGFDNQNLSYFAGLDAIASSSNGSLSILSGDRHLQMSGQPVKPGLLVGSNRALFGWTKELHARSSEPVGNLSFADGHVERVRTGSLSSTFQRHPLVTNRLVIP